MNASLGRYCELLEDPKTFLECAQTPLARTIWANPLKGQIERTALKIEAIGVDARPLSWRPGAWRLPPDVKPGHWLLFVTGEIHVQEEAAMLAGGLLGAKPGERILDLCASPGGKTAQLAVSMTNRGTLIANERARKRLSPLRRNLERLGVTCAAVSQFDGARFPILEQPFDRILVDAPCTCEGTSRKQPGRIDRVDERFRASIIQVQKALLRRATALCKSGGTILYATCTYAPEENEGVLSAISPDVARIEPVVMPDGVRTAPGIPSWQGVRFRSDVRHAHRVWPHFNDTGGFFFAQLRKF
ncbi:MAG: RsmB/NOP family class I SAM-dependent RNA methyltransferase [Myxococcota bacterium]|nr:RsmB/NOP family class I SAM-dependent RNA methyltransferase [Myxococcota bacterium]